MAFLTQLYTNSLSNQNIATALLVGTYTNTSRIRKVYVTVACDQVAGNGSYTCYATVQRAGAGSAYQTTPITTATVASGITSIIFESVAITLNATDVLKIYVLGLAGDTTTPDIVVDVNEEFVLTDSSGNVTFTNTSIATVTSVTNDVGITQAGADKVWGTTIRTLSAAGVQAIWDALTSTLTTVGSIGKLLVDNINATISSRSTYAGGAVASVTGNVGGNVTGSVGSLAAQSKTDVENAVWDAVQASHVAVGTTGESLNDAGGVVPPTVQSIVDGVWDEALASHLDAGSTGEALNEASNATIFPSGANQVTITIRNSITSSPIDGATVWLTTDLAGTNTVWAGSTDAFGVARNVLGELPALSTGTYYRWVQDSGYTDSNPTAMNVSP